MADECELLHINMNDVRMASLERTLDLVSRTCDKKAEIDYKGRKYIIREVTKKGKTDVQKD